MIGYNNIVCYKSSGSVYCFHSGVGKCYALLVIKHTKEHGNVHLLIVYGWMTVTIYNKENDIWCLANDNQSRDLGHLTVTDKIGNITV